MCAWVAKPMQLGIPSSLTPIRLLHATMLAVHNATGPAGASAWSQCSPDQVTGMRGAQEQQASGCHHKLAHKEHLQVVSDIYNMAYNIEFDVFNMSAISHLCYIAPIYTMGYHTLFVLYNTKSVIYHAI